MPANAVIALDGVDVDPIMVTSINMHIGERADVIVCADQPKGYYAMEMNYDYACGLTKGNFIPPGFHAVTSCRFYGFLHYPTNFPEVPTYGAPTSPRGTGGGAKPRPSSGVRFDLTRPSDWNKTKPVDAQVPCLWPAIPVFQVVSTVYYVRRRATLH